MSEQIYGIHAVKAFLDNAPERLIEVLVLKGREDKRLNPLPVSYTHLTLPTKA